MRDRMNVYFPPELLRQIADLAEAILNRAPPLIDGAEAKIPVELVCGIYESMRTGRPYFFKG